MIECWFAHLPKYESLRLAVESENQRVNRHGQVRVEMSTEQNSENPQDMRKHHYKDAKSISLLSGCSENPSRTT